MAYFYLSESNDCYINAATEEYLLKHLKLELPIIYIWQNANTVFIGKNQNTAAQININETSKDNVNLIRRFSGGGTVFQDMGNVCYSYIDYLDEKRSNAYEFFARPIIEFLNSLNINATFKGRNDLEIEGMKFSGTAQYLYQDKILHHGTLLYDTDMTKLAKYLQVDKSKIQAKGIDSVAKRVTNIIDHLDKKQPVEWFVQELTKFYFKKYSNLTEIKLDNQAKEWIKDRAQNHFKSWDWIYGSSNEYKFNNKKRFTGGELELSLNTDQGKITDIKFNGDFLSVAQIEEIQKALVGVKFDYQSVSDVLDQFDLKLYLGTITKEELMSLLFDNK
ncbi:lipoate--protein ligase [Mycoplasma bradburyae]|uniref:lipoate--protein ligase n=1 Tax=Mycoplasma bradburyae TaxID=2963128 RepID=UPI002340073D|nr:lipoate--protein ligase [Mycoplasma bradburyae]MDC4184250.1 lipoate--protein ligase [Mycoplasma bradburyae]